MTLKRTVSSILFLLGVGCSTTTLTTHTESVGEVMVPSVAVRDCHIRYVTPVQKDIGKVRIGLVTDYDQSSFSFNVENVSDKEFRVLWSESFFINENKMSKKLFSGRIIDRSRGSQDMLVLPHTKASEVVGVSDHVTWNSGWKHLPLCGRVVSNIGKTDVTGCEKLSLKLTVNSDGKKKILDVPLEYTLKLRTVCEGYDLTTGRKL